MPTTIEPIDSRCVVRETGEEAQGRPEDVQVGLSVNEDGSMNMSMNLVDQIIATWSFPLQTGDGFVLQEISETAVFENFPVDVYSQDPLQVTAPAGETASGQLVDPASMSLVDLTVSTSEDTPDGEVQGTYTFFPEQVEEAIASIPLEISGAPGQP